MGNIAFVFAKLKDKSVYYIKSLVFILMWPLRIYVTSYLMALKYLGVSFCILLPTVSATKLFAEENLIFFVYLDKMLPHSSLKA